MNSHPWISCSTSYTLWGLSRRYLVVLRRDLTIAPIISGVGLRNFARSHCANRTLRRIQRRVTNFWVHSSVICLQLSIACCSASTTRATNKRSLYLKNVARQKASLSAQTTIFAFLALLYKNWGGAVAGARYPCPVIYFVGPLIMQQKHFVHD